MKLQKIGFIGLGLIGGSIAKRLRILHKDLVIIATAGHAATIEAAYKEGLTDNASPVNCQISMTATIFFCARLSRKTWNICVF